ncbi:MAG: gamma-glutamyl-gamma-aminobutyrate hydrolase family protein [Lawsonibacter sp.]|nr:gamma-glutamyl-gamma-aminobutyrate hydrolase family protein [Lawsonibacter sp.]
MTAPEQVRLQVSGDAGKMENYCAAVQALGGVPVSGYCPPPDLSCSGLVLCGGGDAACELYGQENRGSQLPDRERDRAELALFQAFYQAGKPILGICRGMQLINIALGGTLIQDLPPGQKVFHAWDERDMVHPVRSREGSLLHRLYGPVFPVNSAHHQALDRLGEGLQAIAWAESGFPEAVSREDRLILAVQFHPERMAFQNRRPDTVDGEGIFRAFLELCRWGETD